MQHQYRHRRGRRFPRSASGPSGHGPFPTGGRRIVLAGNPNVGKSVVFNALTGLYVDVSNYPGTTVDLSSGRWGSDLVVDTPGIYGVSSFTDEERVAREIIVTADIIINVIDGAHLERDLFLTLHLADLGRPMVVALNMLDEARRSGLRIDTAALEAALGVPVVPTVAVRGEGLDQLKAAIEQARTANSLLPPELQAEVNRRSEQHRDRAEALLSLEDDAAALARTGTAPSHRREEIYQARRTAVDRLVKQVVQETSEQASFGTILGRLAVRPLTGLPLLALILWGLYQLIGVFVAQTVVGFTEETLLIGYWEPLVRGLVGRLVDLESVVGQLLAGEFGLLTMTITYLLGLLLPLVVGFYLFLSLLEDSGYLPRIAVLVDRVLTGIGLNGRAIIPIIVGLGCVTMATMTTRALSTTRERRIAIFLVTLAVPCSAQLGVILGLLAPLGPVYFAVYLAVITLVFGLTGKLLNTVLPGRSSDLLIDLPPLRWPILGNVVRKTWAKSYSFIREAAPLFAVGALLIGILQQTGTLAGLEGWLAPLTVGWLGLPAAAARAFIMGFVRRDFGAAGLSTLAMSHPQQLAALVTITLFVPCIASVLTIIKERGRVEGALMWVGSLTIAFLVGGVVFRLAQLLPA
ncbi:MAG: ferrous iron transport protein B [Bacillota bacterium]